MVSSSLRGACRKGGFLRRHNSLPRSLSQRGIATGRRGIASAVMGKSG
jgi:hypothetical protein